jgi:hypothetical protein
MSRSEKYDWIFDLVLLPGLILAGIFSAFKKKP